MHVVSYQLPPIPTIEADGIIFLAAMLQSHSIGKPSQSIRITPEFARLRPVLRRVTGDKASFIFTVNDPGIGLIPPSRTEWSLPITLYVDWNLDVDRIREMLEESIDVDPQPTQVTEFAEEILTAAFRQACIFISILRQDFLQYWLVPPTEPSMWSHVLYYSNIRKNWYYIPCSSEFSEDLTGRNWGEFASSRVPFRFFRVIQSGDAEILQTAHPVPEPSFAQEMIAHALTEISDGRLRSSILHSIIALESSTKRALATLLRRRLRGLEENSTLEAISRELSLVKLARVVLDHLNDKSNIIVIDWTKIDALYECRNTIVHRSRRRLPEAGIVEQQLLEVWEYVRYVDSRLNTLSEKHGHDTFHGGTEPTGD